MPDLTRRPYLPLYTAAIRNDPEVAGMSLEARGAYFFLLLAAWDQSEPGVLRDDDQLLAYWSATSLDQWRIIRDDVARAFDTKTRIGHWMQRRMIEEAKAVTRTRKRLSNAGKAGRAQQLARTGSPGNGAGVARAQGRKEGRNRVLQEEPNPLGQQAGPHANGASAANGEDPDPERMSVAVWFEQVFWPEYPRKVAKTAARKSLLRAFKGPNSGAEDALGDAIMDGLDLYKQREWHNRELELVPHAATWLNQRRWEDANA